MRNLARRGAAVFACGALMVVALPALPAHAGVWQSVPGGVNRTCSNSIVSLGHSHQICLDYNASRTQVRAIGFINPASTASFSVNLRLGFGGGGPSSPLTCTTTTTSASRACITGWAATRRPYVMAEGAFVINGSTRLAQRTVDTPLAGKNQQADNWCGPAAVQTIIATMGISAPPQSTLAEQMGTGWIGTQPELMDNGINRYVPQDFPYRAFSFPHGGPIRLFGLSVLVDSIARGRPVAVLVIPGQLPWWPDNTLPTYRHYIVVHGFGGQKTTDPEVAEYLPWNPVNFKVWDPGAGIERNLTVEQLFEASEGAYLPVDELHMTASSSPD